jgi:hypothetical protein
MMTSVDIGRPVRLRQSEQARDNNETTAATAVRLAWKIDAGFSRVTINAATWASDLSFLTNLPMLAIFCPPLCQQTGRHGR